MPDKEYKPAPKVIAKEQEINLTYSESGNLHRRLIETVRSGIFLGDAQGKLTYVNHAFAEMLGYGTKDELIGVNFLTRCFVSRGKRKISSGSCMKPAPRAISSSSTGIKKATAW